MKVCKEFKRYFNFVSLISRNCRFFREIALTQCDFSVFFREIALTQLVRFLGKPTIRRKGNKILKRKEPETSSLLSPWLSKRQSLSWLVHVNSGELQNATILLVWRYGHYEYSPSEYWNRLKIKLVSNSAHLWNPRGRRCKGMRKLNKS